MPIEAQVSPFPRELTTPPVTKMCLAICRCPSHCPRNDRSPRGSCPWAFHVSPTHQYTKSRPGSPYWVSGELVVGCGEGTWKRPEDLHGVPNTECPGDD